MAVTWSGGALARRFACVSFSGSPCCVPSYIHTFWCLRRRSRTRVGPLRVWTFLLLFWCPGICGLCVVWRWSALRSRVIPSSCLHGGVPHNILLSVRSAYSIESIESIRGWLGGGVVLVVVVCSAEGALLGYTLLCLWRFTQRAFMGISPGPSALAGALACVPRCGVPFVFFRVALFVWRVSSLCCFQTHLTCLMASLSYACGE